MLLVKLTADLEKYVVYATPLGINPSGMNGFCLKRDVKYTLHHGDKLELLLDQYFYEIVFDPPPNGKYKKIAECSITSVPSKRKYEEDIDSRNCKQQKIHNGVQKSDEWEIVDNKNLYIFTSEGVQSKAKVIENKLNFFFKLMNYFR